MDHGRGPLGLQDPPGDVEPIGDRHRDNASLDARIGEHFLQIAIGTVHDFMPAAGAQRLCKCSPIAMVT